jgi:quinolinate synthase
MAMNGLQNLADVLKKMDQEISVDRLVGQQAVKSINRMLDFAATRKANVQPGSDLADEGKLFSKVGPA